MVVIGTKGREMIEIKNRVGRVLRTVDADNLSDADLRGANLRAADLRYADLRAADLHGAKLRGADLYGADLHGADLRAADLSGADLRDADLRDANLRGAKLYGANLSGANLRGARLSGAQMSEVLGVRVVAVTWSGHGEQGRQLLAVDDQDEGVTIYHCGCFRGTREGLIQYIKTGDGAHQASRTLTLDVVDMLLAANRGRESDDRS